VGACVLLGLLIGVVGATWANRLGQPGLPADNLQGSMRMMGRYMLRRGNEQAPPQNEEALDLSISPLIAQEPAGPRPGLPLTGEIVPCCALAGDARRGLLLAGTREGTLHWYEAKTLRRLGSCRLYQPAYRLAFDGARGLLYAASTPASSLLLGRLGDRERASGDLHVYDLSNAQLRPVPAGPLLPVRSFPLAAQVLGMILTPDGAHLYYLSETTRTSQVERIDTQLWQRDKTFEVRLGGPAVLTQSPLGGALYVLSGGRLYVLDPQSWNVQREMRVGATVITACAGKDDHLYILERREGMYLHVYDLRATAALGRLALWPVDTVGRIYLRMASDGKRLYVSNSAVTHGSVQELDVSGKNGLPTPVRDAISDPRHLLRGPLLLGPDARYAVTGSGHVFRLAS
jgi:hypothetical protein